MKYAKIIFNLIQKKPIQLSKQQWQNFIDFARENEILPFISYLLERANIKILIPNLQRELYVLRQTDILRSKIFKRELTQFIKLTSKYKPIIFKGGIHLLNSYWMDYDGYISQDIDLLFPVRYKAEILNTPVSNYHIIDHSYERVTIQNHERTVTIDLHFYPFQSNKDENEIIKLLVKNSSKVTINEIRLGIPDTVSCLIYRIFHMFFHHNDFPPLPMRDFLDFYFLLGTIKQPETVKQLYTSLKQTKLHTFFIHLYQLIPGETPRKLDEILTRPSSSKLLSLLTRENSTHWFLQYPIARAILWRMRKMETQRSTEFLNLIRHSLVEETIRLYTSPIYRIFHMLKTVFLTVLGEGFITIK